MGFVSPTGHGAAGNPPIGYVGQYGVAPLDPRDLHQHIERSVDRRQPGAASRHHVLKHQIVSMSQRLIVIEPTAVALGVRGGNVPAA